MQIKFHKRFEKSLKKLSPDLKKKTIEAIEKFTKNPKDKLSRNHSLKAKMKGKRAFSVTGDCRVIFEEVDGYIIVVMLDVGSHNQVY